MTTGQIKKIVELAGPESGFEWKGQTSDEDGFLHGPDGRAIVDPESSPWVPLLVLKAIDGVNALWIKEDEGNEITTEGKGVFVYLAYHQERVFLFSDMEPDQSRLNAILWVIEHKGEV